MPQQLTLFEEMLQDLIGDNPTLHNVETIGLLSKTIHYAVDKALDLAAEKATLTVSKGDDVFDGIIKHTSHFPPGEDSTTVTIDKQSILGIKKLFI